MSDITGLLQTFDVLTGWSFGYGYMTSKNKEDEVKQGENYYIASIFTIGQIGVVTSVIKELAYRVLDKATEKASDAVTDADNFEKVNPLLNKIETISNSIYYLSIPFCVLAAAAKHDHIRKLATVNMPNHPKVQNFVRAIPKFTPNALLRFSADHLGKALNVAMVAGAVTFIVFKEYALGGSLLAGLAFQVVDKKGWLPRKVSLFAETYFPLVSHFVFMFGRGVPLLARGISLVEMLPEIDIINRIMQRQVTKLAVKPSLADYEAPLIEKKDLSFDEIMQVLNDDQLSKHLDKADHGLLISSLRANYEINPAHCSKSVFSGQDLAEDHHFDSYLDLLERTDWTQYGALLESKFIDCERFLQMLHKKLHRLSNEQKVQFDEKTYPALHQDSRENIFNFELPQAINISEEQFAKLTTAQKESLNQRIREFKNQRKAACHQMIQLLAIQNKQTPEHYLAALFKEKATIFVKTLKGEIRVEGSQQDLDDSIHNSAKILHYLKSLDPKQKKVDIEDILVKLFIEGGDYCARAIKRSSSEILPKILADRLVDLQSQQPSTDPVKDYELKIKAALQEARQQEIEYIYQSKIKSKIPEAVSSDVHTFDLYRAALSLGFAPLTEYERRHVDLCDILIWIRNNDFRTVMLARYAKKMVDAVEKVKKIHLMPYLQQVLNANPKLSAEQRDQIIELFTDRNDSKWTVEDTERRFISLMFVFLGVLRKKG